MADEPPRVRRRGSGLHARLRRVARVVLLFLVVLVMWIGSAATADDLDSSASTDSADVCAEAERLVDEGRPSQALDLIARHRGTDAAGSTSGPLPEDYYPEDACRDERALALVNIERGAAYAILADRLQGEQESGSHTGGPTAASTEPVSVSAGCPEVGEGDGLTVEQAKAFAKQCDRGEEAPPPSTSGFLASLQKSWTTTKENVLDPLGTLILPAAVVAAALLVGARLMLPLVPRWPRLSRTRSWPLVTASMTTVFFASACLVSGLIPITGVLAGVLLVVVPLATLFACGVAVLEKHPYWLLCAIAIVALASVVGPFVVASPHFAKIAVLSMGGLLAVAALALVATEMATRLRLSISVRNAEGSEQEADLTHLVALLEEMGGDGPQGVEVPRGADLTALTSSVITKDPTNVILKVLWSAWSLLVGAAPWRIQVDTDARGTINLVMTRNGRPVGSAVVRPDELTRELEVKETKARLDPYRFVAAAVLVQLARHHDLAGLYGVTSWKSLGYHCMATIDLKEWTQEAAQKEILLLALRHQPQNLPAQLALERSLYRKATTDAELKAFGSWLTGYLDRLDEEGLRQTPLALRAHNLRATTIINRRYGMNARPAPDLREAVNAFGFDVAEIRQQRDARNNTDVDEFVERMAEKVRWLKAAYLSRGTPKVLEWPPSRAYSAACYHATREPPRDDSAVRFLQIADRDLELADWRAADPQLAGLRTRDEYRRAYPRRPRKSLLELSLMVPYKKRLSELQVVDADAILAFVGSPSELARLIRTSPEEARRVIRTAELASLIQARRFSWDTVLPAFAVEIVQELLDRGVVDSHVRKAWVRRNSFVVATSITEALTDRLDRKPPPPFQPRLAHWLTTI